LRKEFSPLHFETERNPGDTLCPAFSALVAQFIPFGNLESYDQAWRDQYGGWLGQSRGTMERFIRTSDVRGFEHAMEYIRGASVPVAESSSGVVART
jgi:hypothetical protein